jgi:lipopolysaccharide biosynthesis regulator YciM
MDFDVQWLLWGLPLAFALGWLASRFDVRQWRRELQGSPKAYYKGLNLLLNEQQDKAIDAFIEAVQQDPDTLDLHFALGNLFRRRGEYERAVRVHQHLLNRGDLPQSERERAQYGLAQDFMKAGLFDRAEDAHRALLATPFDTEARLALLALYERSRDWRAAIEVAQALEQSGTGSFASHISHCWCELALEADARKQTGEADAALAEARKAAPLAARPLVLAGQRAAARGDHAAALAHWAELMTAQPAAFNLVAADYAASATAAGDSAGARERLMSLYRRSPSVDLLLAIAALEPDAAARRVLLLQHLRAHPTLSAAQALLDEEARADGSVAPQATRRGGVAIGGTGGTGATDDAGDGLGAVAVAVRRGARPVHRYRCAACGFEAEHYFWQCPGCLGWDTYPPQRLEDLG